MILCYGDSNTWGFDPRTKGRYAAELRWTGVLRAEMGAGHTVIEEGLNGRTTVWPDPLAEWRNGKALLTPILETHKPLDWVVIALGVNDLKQKYSATVFDIGRGAAALVDIAQRSRCGREGGAPKVLLIAPPVIKEVGDYAEMFVGGRAKSERLAAEYAKVAREFGCELLDAGEIVVSSGVDGIHWDLLGHEALGRGVAEKLRMTA